MKPKSFYCDPFHALSVIFHLQEEGENFATGIKESKYEKADVEDDVKEPTHLTYNQCADLLKIFSKQTKLFPGISGKPWKISAQEIGCRTVTQC
jgi:hypothetical protein